MRYKLCVFLFLAFLFQEAFPQKIEILAGDPKSLKGMKFFNIEYDYSDLLVDGKKEKVWVANCIRIKDSIKQGNAYLWHKKWLEGRESDFEIRFEENLNQVLKKCGISTFDNQQKADYTLILKTMTIEPDANTGVGTKRRNAYAGFQAIFVDSKDKKKILLKLEIKKCLGGVTNIDFDDDCVNLVTVAYGVCGKALGKYLNKFL